MTAIPFITQLRATAVVGGRPQDAITLHFDDQDGVPVATSVATIEDVDRLGRDLIALAHAATTADPSIRFGDLPRTRTRIMHDLVLGPRQQLIETEVQAAKGGVAALARMLQASVTAAHP